MKNGRYFFSIKIFPSVLAVNFSQVPQIELFYLRINIILLLITSVNRERNNFFKFSKRKKYFAIIFDI